jgi:hypothetical protein
MNPLQLVLQRLQLDSKQRIPMAQIEAASKTEGVVDLSILREIICRHWNQIVPEPDNLVCFNALIHFYILCIEKDPDPTDTVLTRYEAGTELYRTILRWIQLGDKYYPFVALAIENLKDSYVSGGEKIRTAIETSCIEHLFEYEETIPFFRDWKNHELLCEAYNRGLEWIHNLKNDTTSDNDSPPER